MNKYFKKFTIPYFDTDNEELIKVDRILAYMAETSTWHSDTLGLSLDEIRKNNYGWMLIKWELEIEEYPKAKDNVSIGTWTSGFNKFYATREFQMIDSSENIVAKASSLWVFLDINKRRPIRITKDIIEKYSIIEQKNFDVFSNIEIEGDVFLKSDKFKVVENDLDENNHVNNIKYIEWLLLILAEKQKKYRIKKLAVNYKKELLIGDSVHTEVIHTKEENKLYHKVLTDEDTNAIAISLWEKKETSS
ncbi:MAG: thioesterase [Gudongella sp.]|nr:thioesterase [Gudongella sp.]